MICLCFIIYKKTKGEESMKKLFSFILVAAIIVSGSVFLGGGKTEAATYDSWQSVPTGGKIRIIRDYNSYGPTATSVDAKIQSDGNTGKLYYEIYLSLEGRVYSRQKGYFSTETPWKILKLPTDTLKGITLGGSITVTLYKDSGYKQKIKSYYSSQVLVKR